MTEAARVEWWAEQISGARRAIAVAQEERRQPYRRLPDEDPRGRRSRVPALPPANSERADISGATVTGNRDAERARSLAFPNPKGRGGDRADGVRSRSSNSPAGSSIGQPPAAGGALARARQLAAGYQPAVVKVVSYARGAARATATGQYVQRQDVILETHDGRMLATKEAVAEEINLWSKNFSKRAETQDVASVRIRLHALGDTPEGRETYENAIAAGLIGHRYAYRLETNTSGDLEARVVIALAGPKGERFRIRGQAREAQTAVPARVFNNAVEQTLKSRIEVATGHPAPAIGLMPGTPGHGREGVMQRLGRLIEKGPAIDDRGKTLLNATDMKVTAREWGPALRSQSSRDTMHLILSAKAGTNIEALARTARSFLNDRFADHKFMFGVHSDKEAEGHIHVHAVITVKNASGQKIHPGRETFRDWREAYAEHAQVQGLKIVASGVRERTSSQSYGPRDKAIVEAAERPRAAREVQDCTYAADPVNRRLIDNARYRIQAARTNPIRIPLSASDRQVVDESASAWRAVRQEQPSNSVARDMIERLTMAQTLGGILHAIEKRVQYLTQGDRQMAVTAEQMSKDLASMNDAVARTSDLLEGATRHQFQEKSVLYLEALAHRIDLQRLHEKGIYELSRSEVETIAGAGADRLIEQASTLTFQRRAEVLSVERAAERAIGAELREEARSCPTPEIVGEISIERAIVAGENGIAAHDAREGAFTMKAVRLVTDQPEHSNSQLLPVNDTLSKLRAEQERIVRECEVERLEKQAIKAQRMS